MVRLWVALTGLILAACGGGSGTTILLDSTGTEDVGSGVDATPTVLPDVVYDGMDGGTDFQVNPPEVDAAPDGFVEPGSFGWPCGSDSQCISGYCVFTPDGGRCTVACDGECPDGWLCAQDMDSVPDVVHVCIPAYLNLCRPCKANADCLVGGVDGGERCVGYGAAGSFCAPPCGESGACPPDYICQDATEVGGTVSPRCVRDSGECPCNDWFVDQAASTLCAAENEFGACPGERHCGAEGLTPCDASVPEAESCNGVDDDCDGKVDEGTDGAPCAIENEWGACSGVDHCDDGVLECLAEKPEPEACDGKDNDCDQEVDEGFPDTDADGLADCMETDKDGDTVADVSDNCPFVPNVEQTDTDLDGSGDACDLDDDNDKVADGDDCAPLDGTVFPGAAELCDGKDNDCDALQDEGFPDSDADGLKDCADVDDDNDGVVDEDDCQPLSALAHPGADEVCDGVDNDCDGEVDEGFGDLDLDGAADCVDSDADGDGAPNVSDNCPGVANADQGNQDGDSLGDACDDDIDGDGIPNGLDDCPGTFDPAQQDTDGDGIGDVCEADLDGDGVANEEDNCPGVMNGSQADLDGDGAGDPCDDDMDGDGEPNATDCKPMDGQVHPGVEEVCDGADNNCSGTADEGFPDYDLDGQKDCVDEDDDNDGSADVDDCGPHDPTVHPAAQESCDGVDEDCDGEVDQGLGTVSCGKGVCAQTIAVCVDGELQYCNPFGGAGQEVCDGKDNDCDGQTDEGLGSSACGLGVCAHSVPVCVDGEVVVCDPMEGAGVEECDGKDNDCDGQTDEGLGSSACGLGVCAHSVPVCVDGEVVVCDPMKGAGVEECDGKDNDCDGETDEELGSSACGLGVCAHSVPVCVDGTVQVCNPFAGASPEVCDGSDNDCDGETDEAQGVTTCGLGECVHTVANCVDGTPQECDPLAGAEAEVCDGLDNDCDGTLDEGLGTMLCGLGICQQILPACLDGEVPACDPFKGTEPESCDGADNDCDGETDEEDAAGCVVYHLDGDGDGFGTADSRCLCIPEAPYDALSPADCNDEAPLIHPDAAETCGDGVDDDCDGTPDDGCILANCEAILSADPAAESGTYAIDPDGEGGAEPLTVHCEMAFSDGGWTQMTSAYLATLGDESKEYLYVANGAWYRSPPTSHVWSWSTYQPVNGTYHYGKADPIGSFGCTHGEQGFWGVGCSNCPGGCWKCFVHGGGYKDTANGRTTICQDQPNVFGYGACGQPVQLYVR